MTYITFNLANSTFQAPIGADPSIILGLLPPFSCRPKTPTKPSTL